MKTDVEIFNLTMERAHGLNSPSCFQKGYQQCQEDSKDLLIKEKAVIEYCYDHLDQMWAARITGILLGCDFRDAKEYSDLFFKYCEEVGI